jgi:hypothetical protein
VAEVVEPERPQPCGLDGDVVPSAQGRAVDVAGELADEHEVIVVGGVAAVAQLRQGGSYLGRHRNRPHFAALGRGQCAARIARADADGVASKVDVAPAQR